jgi:hypothetical protein
MSAWNRSTEPQVSPRRPDGSRGQTGLHVGPLRITPVRAILAIAFLGSAGFIAFAVIKVRDVSQLPMISSGFAVMGLAFVALAIGGLIEMWRAASEARTGRAMALAIGGGLAGMAAIGCFSITVVLALLTKH